MDQREALLLLSRGVMLLCSLCVLWALFSIFPAIIAAIMIGLLYIYPIKK